MTCIMCPWLIKELEIINKHSECRLTLVNFYCSYHDVYLSKSGVDYGMKDCNIWTHNFSNIKHVSGVK